MAACRNLIAGTVSQLNVRRSRGVEALDAGLLLTRPDPDVTWTTQIEWTIDDLLFYGHAAWLVIARDGIQTEANPDGLPVRARRVPPTQIERLTSDRLTDYSRTQGYRINGTKVRPDDVIWFEAGHEGILTYGAATLAAAYDIEQAAKRMAAVELPAGVLKNEGAELGPEEAAELAAAWTSARQSNSVAVLQGMSWERTQLDAHDLQLVEARALASTQVARLANVPVSMVSASPSGNAAAMLYANLGMQTAAFVRQAVAPLLQEIEQVMSGDAVTPRGHSVRFDVARFLRTDPEAAMAFTTDLLAAGVIDTDEARIFMGLPPVAQEHPTATPGDMI